MKTPFLFTCKICGHLYEEDSSTITIYDIEKQEEYRSTKLCVCQKCLYTLKNIIKGLALKIHMKKTVKKHKTKKEWTEAQATRWALDHIS